MDRKSLVESLIISDSPEKSQSKLNWKSIIIFLAFSLNPLTMIFGKAINLSGLVPFTLMISLISALFYYMSSIVINSSFLSHATSYSELFNNYFHRLDRFINLIVLFCTFSYICLLQAALFLEILGGYRDISDYYSKINIYELIGVILVINICVVIMSQLQELRHWIKICLCSLVLISISVVVGFIIIYFYSDTLSDLVNCGNYLFSKDYYLSVYILLATFNLFQSFSLIFEEIKDSNQVIKRESYGNSLKIALVITVISYLVLGVMLSFLERITSSRYDGPEVSKSVFWLMSTLRTFKIIWFTLQISLNVVTLKSSFFSTFCSTEFEVSKLCSILTTIVLILLSNFSLFYLYTDISGKRKYQRDREISCFNNDKYVYQSDPNPYDDYYFGAFEDLFLKHDNMNKLVIANAYCCVVVGLGAPLGLMIRTNEYSIFKILPVGAIISGILALLIYTNLYSRTGFYFPI